MNTGNDTCDRIETTLVNRNSDTRGHRQRHICTPLTYHTDHIDHADHTDHIDHIYNPNLIAADMRCCAGSVYIYDIKY